MTTCHQLISVDEGMVIFLMNKQTLVTSCPTRTSVKKGSLQFASLQHSEKKNHNLTTVRQNLINCIDQRELCGLTLMFKKSLNLLLVFYLFFFKGLSCFPTSLHVAGRLFS